MNVIVWARVSSREQREGYSLDAQLRAARDRAQNTGWTVVREFVVAESAKRGAERLVFNEMFKWVKANAKRENIKAILSHKLDRVCRNMRDAVRLQELEDSCGVQLAFVDNQFGPGAAGALSFNVMAAVAQYYSDNLRSEVLKGMDEKVRQGWPTGGAPYGYMNVADRECPVIPHPEKSKAVIRIFEVYARGNVTFKELADLLAREGYIYQPSQPRFHRTALSYILNNRFYVGEIVRRGQTYPGKFQALISRELFQTCQDILSGKNRRGRSADTPLAGGILRCAHCGFAITGERIRRKVANGAINEHIYYRCGNNHKPAGHPKVRWRHEDVDAAILRDLQTLQIKRADIRQVVRSTLNASCDNLNDHQNRQRTTLARRQSELQGMLDRLLNAYLGGTVDEGTLQKKSEELKRELSLVNEALERVTKVGPGDSATAVAVFDFSQEVAEYWQRSTWPARREILVSVSLNRALSDVSLCLTKRKPFDLLAEGLLFGESRGDRI